jgi:HD-like signal output (HDOD) protein
VPHPAPPLPRRFGQRLPAAVAITWHELAPFDRRHLVAVAEQLERAGHPDHVVLAGLLHDIGKVGRITVVDRVAMVLLRRLSPVLLDRLAASRWSAPFLEGLHLLLRHAERGADLLADAGMPAEVTWLVRHHERPDAHPELRALQAADHRH